MQVVELHRYPVKSLGGQDVTSLELEPWGPVGDRRWAITDPLGRLKTARTLPGLLAMSAEPTEVGIRLTDRHGRTLVVAEPHRGPRVQTTITRSAEAHDAGDDAAEFLSEAIGAALRLVWQADPRTRSVNPRNGGLPHETLSFADAGPILVTSRASLVQLQERIGTPPSIGMERFRPNVVIDGEQPFEENDWSGLQIGSVRCRVQQRCDRCTMTTIDPATGRRGDEPLDTLTRDHSIDGRPVFGLRVVPETPGTLDLGDEVIVR